MILALIEMSVEKAYKRTTINLVLIMQMLMQGLWWNQDSIVNIPNFGKNILLKLSQDYSITSLPLLIHFYKKNVKAQEIIKQLIFEQGGLIENWVETKTVLDSLPIIRINGKLEQQEEESKLELYVENTNSVGKELKLQKVNKTKDLRLFILVCTDDHILKVRKIGLPNKT